MLMTYPHSPENIKVCPQCGTNLIRTARRCAVCGYRFTDASSPAGQAPGELHQSNRSVPPVVSLPVVIALVALLISMFALLILGLQKRSQTKALVAAEQATATYLATTYISPTPSPTSTFTPAPPTRTPVVDIEYTVAPGDSCFSIVKQFNIDLNSLLMRNDIDCSLLKIGTVLKIPHPTETPEPVYTATAKP